MLKQECLLSGQGRISELRELKDAKTKTNVWRRICRLGLDGLTLELVIQEDQFKFLQAKGGQGLFVRFTGRMVKGLDGDALPECASIEPVDEIAAMKEAIAAHEKSKNARPNTVERAA